MESERDALNVLAEYRLWLVLRAQPGSKAPPLHVLADLYGVELHWVSRKLREWEARHGDLSRVEGSARPSTVTPKMIELGREGEVDVLVRTGRG